MLDATPVKKFRKDIKLMNKQGKDLSILEDIIDKLRRQQSLDIKYKDHSLNNNWAGCRECHLTSDWLLIYKVDIYQNKLWLLRTGSHSELFNECLCNMSLKELNQILELYLK